MAWRAEPAAPIPGSLLLPGILFFGFYLFLIGVMALWSRLIARRVEGSTLFRRVRFYDTVMFGTRIAVLIWFGVGTFFLGWGQLVMRLSSPLNSWPLEFPETVIG